MLMMVDGGNSDTGITIAVMVGDNDLFAIVCNE